MKIILKWSLIKMRYREIPVGYSVECADLCNGFCDSGLLAVGSTREEAIENWNRKVNDNDV